MDVKKGKIIDLIDNGHVLFETDNKEKIWLGITNTFGLNMVGKDFIAESVPRYSSLSILEIPDGKFKLIGIENFVISENKNCRKFFFKDNKTGKIMEVTIYIDNIKVLNLGKNYKLDLVEDYKAVNPLPNIKENKTNDNEVIYILNKKKVDKHYLAQWNNKTIEVSISGSENPDKYLGKSVLVQLFRKKIAQTMYVGNEVLSFPQSKVTFNSAANDDYLVTKQGQLTLMQSPSLIFSYDSGATIDVQYLPVYIGLNPSLKRTNKNSGYLLSAIYNDGTKPSYMFINAVDNTDKRLVSFPVEVDLENAIGQYFTTDSYPLLSAKNLQALTETSNSEGYILETILENKTYIFSKENNMFYVKAIGFDISSSKTGKPFSLELIPIINGIILDFESAL